MRAIPITVRERLGVARLHEIVKISAALPQSMARPSDSWRARSTTGKLHCCQVKPLAHWADGSVKWAEFSFPVAIEGGATARFEIEQAEPMDGDDDRHVRTIERDDCVEIQTGSCTVRIPRHGDRLIEQVIAEQISILDSAGIRGRLVDRQGVSRVIRVAAIESIDSGPLCSRVTWSGYIPKSGLNVRGEWTLWSGSPAIALDLTIHNPSRARHLRGCWDLGDPGSILFRSFSLELAVRGSEPPMIHWRDQLVASWNAQAGGKLEIAQETSGGACDQSHIHVDRSGQMPRRERGYVVRSGSVETRGLRAQPGCAVQRGGRWAAAGIHEFWQQFPKSLVVNGDRLAIGLFPQIATELHELQGGEQKSNRIAFSFGCQAAPAVSEAIGILSPLETRCDTDWLTASRAVSRLPISRENLRPEWHTIAQQAIVGEHSMFAKREIADEFGWRNFGDLWADHEEAHYDGPRPIVSHFNNQYDALEGLLLAYFVTGERQYWELADPLARHIIDIDIYHTKQDRAAYNGGLFWHTNHYRAAATSTHRAYSATNHPAGGGGPSNEHNYSSGLLLYYHLTGNRLAREAVISLAEWVLNMDDARGHVLGLVHESPTGFASRTADVSYHGPGRGAGNSINALLDGWEATGQLKFLEKAEELIRRAIHPHDDIDTLNLDNAELRWSYTVFLQSLIRILTHGSEYDFSHEFLNYVRFSLVHYARWMAAHETFYLDRPEQLEFPTETWAAHEIRKANVLIAAANYVTSNDADLFRAKAEWFYDRSWASLMSFSTWHYTRPTVLALQLGLYSAAYADAAHFRFGGAVSLPEKQPTPQRRFIPQKEAVRLGLRSPGQLIAMLVRLARVWRWKDVWNSTWAAQRLRRIWGSYIV